jgi:hypothetical protein
MPGYRLCYIHNDQVNKYNLTPFANISGMSESAYFVVLVKQDVSQRAVF